MNSIEELPREIISQIMAASPVVFAKLAQTARAHYAYSVSKAGRDAFARICAVNADDLASFEVINQCVIIHYKNHHSLCNDLPTAICTTVAVGEPELALIKLKLFSFCDSALYDLPFVSGVFWRANEKLHRTGGPATMLAPAPDKDHRGRICRYYRNGVRFREHGPSTIAYNRIEFTSTDSSGQLGLECIYYDGILKFSGGRPDTSVNDIRTHLAPYEDDIRRCFPRFRYVDLGERIIAQV